jgi:hypothetical protein
VQAQPTEIFLATNLLLKMATASSKKEVSQENASPKKDESRTVEYLFEEDNEVNYDDMSLEELFAYLEKSGLLDDGGMYFSYILFSAGLCCLLYMSDNIIGYY